MHNGLGGWLRVVLAIWLLGWWVVAVNGQATETPEPTPEPILEVFQINVSCEEDIKIDYKGNTTEIIVNDANKTDEVQGVPQEKTNIPISTWQVVFKVERCMKWTDEQDIRITTCSENTSIETVLLQLSGDPSEEDFTVILSNRFDARCDQPEKRATLQYRVDPVTEEAEYLYFVLAFTPGFEGDGDAEVHITSEKATFAVASWGQDRLDQRSNENLRRPEFVGEPGSGVFAYVVDSGILRTHSQFAVGQVDIGQNFVEGNEEEPRPSPDDCNGHGTYVSALMAGSTYGVARQTTIVPVKVLDCDNKGRTFNLMRAINWVLENSVQVASEMVLMPVLHQLEGEQSALSLRIQTVLRAENITLVAAAGSLTFDVSGNATKEQIQNTCDQTQPLAGTDTVSQSLSNVLSVGASDRYDVLSSFSRYGNCSAIYAPGTDIISAYHTGDYAAASFSSTAAAAGFAAGAVAILLGLNGNMTGSEINRAIVNMGTKEALSLTESELNHNIVLFARGVPLEFPDLIPDKYRLNIYFIYQFRDEDTNDGDCSGTMKEKLKELVEEYLTANNAWKEGANVEIPFCWKEGDEIPVVDSRSATVRQTTYMNVQFQVNMLSIQAAGPYLVIESAVPPNDTEQGALQEYIQGNSDYEIRNVVAVPWVVDSVGRRYWAAPVPVATPDGLSQGVIAGIVLGSILLLSLLVSLVLVIIRWRKPPEVEVQITQGPAKADGRTVVEFHDDPSPGIETLPRQGILDVPLTGLETATVMSAESSEIELENTNFQVESIDGGEAWIWNADNEEIGLGVLGGMIDHLRASNRSDMSEYSGRDILDAPLHTESVGSQTFLLGGGMSGRLSFEDMPSTVAVARSTVAPRRGVDVLHPIVRLRSFEEEILLE